MQRNTLLYYILGAAALTSCADDVVNGDATEYLNGKEKTPIEVSALLDKSNGAGTRAEDMKFDSGDQLIAYLRHVTWDGSTGERTSVTADQAPRLVTFTTTGSEEWSGSDITPIGTGVPLGMTPDNTKQATGLTAQYTNTAGGTTPALYWDDFSNSATDETDLRTSGHYLQSYYGYCYNGSPAYGQTGSSISTDLTATTGVLGWTVQANQTTGIKTSDLLWSAEQTPVEYKHAVTDRKGLVLPYTHAMSKVTIEIVLNEGFDVYADGDNKDKATAFVGKETTPTLFANRVTTTTAPTYTHSTTVASGDDAKIQMHLADDEATTKKVRVYEAIIAPTVMKNGQKLAEVTVDNNKYEINLTDAVLTTKPTGATAEAWSSQLKAYTISSSTLTKTSSGAAYSTENGGITLPGVNYRIKITLNKQKIDVKAYITDWTNVYASATGEIHFSANVVSSTTPNEAGVAISAGSFDLWRSTTGDSHASFDENATVDGVNSATKVSYASGSWSEYDPKIYWKDFQTPYHFRALAKYTEEGAEKTKTLTSVDGSFDVTQGNDYVWGTTAKHTGKEENGTEHPYEKGAPIDPRTGDVPLTFDHAMSMITVKLEDSPGVTAEDDAKVDFTGAEISIVNLYDHGTIELKNGKISNLSASEVIPVENLLAANDATSGTKLSRFVVVPQSLEYMYDGTTKRTGAVTFYNTNDLQEMTDGKVYDVSTLTKVLYTAEEANSYNASLDGAISTETCYTAAEAIAYNAKLEGAVKAGDVKYYTLEEFQALKNNVITEAQYAKLPDLDKVKTEYIYQSVTDYNTDNEPDLTVDEFNALTKEAKLKSGAKDSDDKIKSDAMYTHSDYQQLTPVFSPFANLGEDAFNDLGDDLKKNGNYEATTAIAHNATLPGAVSTSTKIGYTQDLVNAYNATLPGAKKEGYLHHYETKEGSKEASYGSIKTNEANPKIVMRIVLKDKTIYTLDLAKCVADVDGVTPINTWESGKHYTYTITLKKEQIFFRAMVKDWDAVLGGGTANLDWD